MEIYQYLDQIQTELLNHSWKEIEIKYYKLCSELAGKEQAQRIRDIDLNAFQSELNEALCTSLHIADQNSAAALYFEYDMDNEWKSSFFICNDYTMRSEEDDDWASDWISSVKGPDLKEFGKIYAENGFDYNEEAIGITLYLIIKTVIAFGKVAESIEINIPICIGFHDQDPIMRIRE
ncbi:hypothetical protein [Metabacillus fastidiosus]|uniref:hypothetical protein n=1 Tax=Metabacillus fastidiosus TaxID=1458 RepID=UPI003D2BB1A8